MQFFVNSIYDLSPIPQHNSVETRFFYAENTSILTVFIDHPQPNEIEAFESDTYIFALNKTANSGVLYFSILNRNENYSIILETTINVKHALNNAYPIHFPLTDNAIHKFVIIVVDTISGVIKSTKHITAPKAIVANINQLALEQCKSCYSEESIDMANQHLSNEFDEIEQAFESLPVYKQG